MYKEFVSPILDHLDSEAMHDVARDGLHIAQQTQLRLGLLEKLNYQGERFVDERLRVNFMGIEFENPGMVGAGWDKKGKTIDAWFTLGAAGLEAGTIPELEQSGNDKKRQFMIGPGVSINWLGFNSQGALDAAQNLTKYHGFWVPASIPHNISIPQLPVGISIGVNKDVKPADVPEALARVTKILSPFGRYIAINHSSPNTPELRRLLGKAFLKDSIEAVQDELSISDQEQPILIKVSPEMEKHDMDDAITLAMDYKVGMIASNTTANPVIKGKYGQRWVEKGGLAGNDPEYRALATYQLAYIAEMSGGQIPLIGVGGVDSAMTALEKLQAGGQLYQVVTAIREVGPTIFGRINRGLVDWMNQQGVANITEIVGSRSRSIVADRPPHAKF